MSDPDEIPKPKVSANDGTETVEGIKPKKVVKKVNKLTVKDTDREEVKSHKEQIINALIDWHNKPDRKDEYGNDYSFETYKETLKIALSTILNGSDTTEEEANDIITDLSDGDYKISEFKKNKESFTYYAEGIVITSTDPVRP